MDESILTQVPYAMRSEGISGKPEILWYLRPEVEVLAQNPTYENLINYLNKVRPHLTPEEIRRFEESLTRIEDKILEGNPLRKELIWEQILHQGGLADSGITLYISASYDPYEALQYGRRVLMVIDIPLSEIEDFSSHSKECNIKGTLNRKYITAILIRDFHAESEEEHLREELDKALKKTQRECFC